MLKDLQIHICVQTFRKIKDLKHAYNCLITSPLQFIVMCHQLFGNGLNVNQLWLAFTKVPKCLTQKIKHSLQLGNPSFLKEISLKPVVHVQFKNYGGWFVPCRISVFSGRKREKAPRENPPNGDFRVFAWRLFASPDEGTPFPCVAFSPTICRIFPWRVRVRIRV